ncbi:MAG: hypothetical protein ACRD8A_04060 [Candidatus Acidiferrales bacterium]
MSHKDTSAVVVFTFKSVETLLADGGTSSWRLDRSNARQCQFVVCTRNAYHKKVQGKEEHQSAFLIGKISDVVPSPENPDRYLIKFSEYARLNHLGIWKGDRNPVRYTTLAELGIDPDALRWESVPQRTERAASMPELSSVKGSAALTMAEAKKGLALTFGVKPEAIEITIRG